MLRGDLTNSSEGLRFVLSWDGLPEGTAGIQVSDALAPDSSWTTVDLVKPAPGSVGPIRWMAPESLRERQFFQLELPQPELFSVEPSFVDSSESNAVLYLLGQCLPTNATVEVNGFRLAPTLVNSNGVWAKISLNGLPPGQPIIGRIIVIDNATSNTVAALAVESSIIYGAAAAPEQLQGPPEIPPASPSTGRHRGHVTVLKAHDDGGDPGIARLDRGHVTVLKAAADAPSGSTARVAAHRGHVTVLKSAATGGGSDDDCDGIELVAATGEIRCQETDLVIPGRGLDFVWTRTYRSRTGPDTAQGRGWDFSYNVSLTPQPDGTVRLCSGNGRCDTFYPDGTNGWFRDEHFVSVGDLDGDGAPERVSFADGGVWVFHPPGSTAAGKLARIEDRNHNTLTLGYNPAGKLVTIVDTLNRTNTVTYNPVGLIASVIDFSGRVVRYEYDGAGDLRACVSPAVTGTPNGNDFPGGKTNRYEYSRGFQDGRLNHNLTACTDAKGQTWLQVVYAASVDPNSLAFDVVNYVQRGTYREHLRRFAQTPSPANQFAVVKSIITDGAGNVTECFYDSRQRCVRQLEYTGRANPDQATTETLNRPSGKLRAEDPDFFETLREWNPDSLCTRVVHPRGNSTEMLYQRAFNRSSSRVQDHNSSRSNKSRLHDGDLRVLRERACCNGADTDGDGFPDLTERAWYFEYDVRFGSPPGPASQRVQDHNSSRSNKSSQSSSAVTGGGEDDDCDGFATRITDPRGSVTIASYDDRGNLLQTQTTERRSGSMILCDFDYDVHGRVVSATHPADGEGCRRVDTFEYYTDPAAPGFGHLKKATRDNGNLLCGTTDHLRLATSYEYDARGNVIRCVDPRGFDMLWTYNALDQAVTRTTPSPSFGTLVRYTTFFTYDANDNLVQVDHENRDATGALDPVNPLWTSVAEYDVLNRSTKCLHELTHVVQQSSQTNRLFYDANDNLVLVQFPEAVSGADTNNVIVYEYDERNLLFQVLPAPGTGLGAIDRYDYDANGNCRRVSKIDAFTIKQTVMDFDGFDRCVRVTDPLDNVESFAFDANDNLIYSRFDGQTNDVAGDAGNLRLREARYEYDTLNRLTRRIGSFFDIFTQTPIGDGASIARFTYAPNGQLTRETDDNGSSTAYRYDSAGRLSGIARGLLEAGPFEEGVQQITFTHDSSGNVITETQTDRSDLGGTQSFVTTHNYDGLGRLVQSVDNVGNTNAFAYDSRDNCVSEVDALGNETVRAFDGLNRCVQTTAYEGSSRTVTINTSHVEYENRRCVSATDGNGNTTTYGYDSLDRHVLTAHPDGTTVSLIWSPRSNLERLTDANGTVIQYTYDLLDRCVRKNIKPGPGVAGTTTFEEFAYDGRSNLIFGTNNSSMVEFTYTCGPSKEEIEAREKAKADCIAARAAFDGEGNRISLTYPDGREVRYAYDLLNRVTNVSQFAGGQLSQLASYAYDGPGRLARIARANGINTRIQWNGQQGVPLNAGDFGWQQVRGINHARGGGNPVIDQRVFTYDRAQNKTLRAQTSPYVQGGSLSTNFFAYDKAHRLLRAAKTLGTVVESDNTYVLDGMGNRTNVIGLGGVGVYGMSPVLPEPGDFQMNQYTLTPFGAQQYDLNGNVIFIDGPTGGTTFHYDYADRLVLVERAAGPVSVPVVSFTYDPLGRRITRTTYPPAPVTTRLYHDLDSDGDDIIEFQENGAAVASFVLPEVDDEVLVAFSAGGAAIYFHQDDLGNVLALTDDKGNVLERYDYDDFGVPSFLDANGAPLVDGGGQPVTESPLGNPFLFHGMFWDGAAGLYHAGGRESNNPMYEENGSSGQNPLYEPRTGRYLTRGRVHGDPHVDFWTPRNFAGNNPWTAGKVVEKATSGLKDTLKTQVRMAGGRGSKCDVYVWKLAGGGGGGGTGGTEVRFNPKELQVDKVTVRGWDPKVKKEEGGRHTPFHNKYRPQYRTTDVTGEIELESGREMVADLGPDYVTKKRPGRVKYSNIVLKRGYAGNHLIVPVAMDKGLRFALREGGRTVGAGQVTEIVK